MNRNELPSAFRSPINLCVFIRTKADSRSSCLFESEEDLLSGGDHATREGSSLLLRLVVVSLCSVCESHRSLKSPEITADGI